MSIVAANVVVVVVSMMFHLGLQLQRSTQMRSTQALCQRSNVINHFDLAGLHNLHLVFVGDRFVGLLIPNRSRRNEILVVFVLVVLLRRRGVFIIRNIIHFVHFHIVHIVVPRTRCRIVHVVAASSTNVCGGNRTARWWRNRG